LKIDVTRAGVGLSAVMRGMVVRRVLLTLSRFGPKLTKVTVRLSEPPNPLGGVDQRCRMRAWLEHSDGLGAEAINGGFEPAVARAARQLAKRVALAIDGGAGDKPSSLPARNGVARRPNGSNPPRRPRRRPS
jgi:hypothetical protein